MSVRLSVNDAEFQKTLREYLAKSSRTLPQALNEKMFYIVRGAVRGLPKVEKSKIEGQLVSGYELQYKKNGKGLRKATQQGRAKHSIATPLVYKIINARRRFAGKKGLTGSDMRDASRKLIAARMRSVGTLKAGWWGALNILNKAVGKALSQKKEHSMNRIKAPSTATVAKDGFSPSVGVEYNLQAKDEKYQRGIDKRVVESFHAAWYAEMRSMKQYLEDKLKGVLKPKGAPKAPIDMAAIMRGAKLK